MKVSEKARAWMRKGFLVGYQYGSGQYPFPLVKTFQYHNEECFAIYGDPSTQYSYSILDQVSFPKLFLLVDLMKADTIITEETKTINQ